MFKLKKYIAIVIVSNIIFNTTNVFAKNDYIKLTVGDKNAIVNDREVELENVPYIQAQNGALMIPLRFVSTTLGIPNENILFDINTKEITIIDGDKRILFLPNKDKVYLNDTFYTMYVDNYFTSYTEIINNRAYIPLRSLSSLLGFSLKWDDIEKTVTIYNCENPPAF